MFLLQSFKSTNPESEEKFFSTFESNTLFSLGYGNSQTKKSVENHKNFHHPKPLVEFHNQLTKLEKENNSNVIFGFLKKNIIYFGSIGDFFIILKRNNSFNTLLAPASTPQTMSGFIQPGDEFIVCSKSAYKILDEIKIDLDLKQIAEKLSEISTKSNIKIASLFISVIQKENHSQTTTPININPKNDSVNKIIKKAKSLSSSLFLFSISRIKHINSKIIKYVVVLLIVIIIFAAAFNTIKGSIQKNQIKIKAEANKIALIETNLNHAKELLDLNNERSKILAENALKELKKLEIEKLTSKENQEKAQNLLKSLNAILQQNNQSKNDSAKIVYSTSLLKQNSLASQISSDNNNEISILDNKLNTIYYVNIKTKKAETFPLSKYLSSSSFIFSNNSLIFVFGKSAIIQINPETKSINTIIKNSSSWKNIVDMSIYSNNIYLLDSGTNQIWKNIENSSGYDETKPYFESSQPEEVTSFAIDSAIYLIENNSVNKYLSGTKESFTLQNISGNPLTKPTKIVTSDKLSNIYILEPSTKRIVIFDKKGRLIKQISNDKIGLTKTFTVNETDQEIYFPIKQDIYKIAF